MVFWTSIISWFRSSILLFTCRVAPFPAVCMEPSLPLFIRQNPTWPHPSSNTALVSAVLAAFPGDQCDFTVFFSSAALELLVVPCLYRSSEECPTGRTHLSSIV